MVRITSMYLERSVTGRLKSLFASFPVVVLAGARQVGKSTLLQHVLGEVADSVVFDPVVDVANARSDPELFLDNFPPPLILDEIQYAPELVPAVKRRVDRNRQPGQYVLTGSQQWGVLRSTAESLAGRAVFLDLEGFSLAEIAGRAAPSSWLESWIEAPDSFLDRPRDRLAGAVTLYEQLWRGWLPEVQGLPLDMVAPYWEGYLRTYLERDVRVLADVSDWQTFGRFVRLLGALTSQEINHSQLGRELGLSPQTAKRWVDLLVATFQWHEVAAFSGNLVKRASVRGKGYVADSGLVCAAQAISSPKALADHPLLGALFETAVVAEIRKQVALLSPRPAMYHWRRHGGAEVDLVLERDGVLYPVEVKARSRPSRRDCSGLAAFRAAFPALRIAPGLIVAPCERLLRLTSDVIAIPWDLAPDG